jgi:hypothetical protein
MSKTIKRLDIQTKTRFVELIFDEQEVYDGGKILNTENKGKLHKKPAADSFLRAMSKLVPHLAYSLQLFAIKSFDQGFFDNYLFDNEPDFTGISVTGIVVLKDQVGIKILGRKTTDWGAACPLNSHNIYWEPKEGSYEYPLIAILEDNWDDIQTELNKYLKGNYAPDPQGELFKDVPQEQE